MKPLPSVLEEEEESPGVLEEEESPGVEEQERCSGPPTSPLSRPMKPPHGVREEERCGSGWSFPPHGTREKKRCGSRKKQTSRSDLGSVFL
jgi:hypothetical protein